MKNIPKVTKMVIASLLLAIGIILPFLTMQIPEIGNMLLPMHLPVFISGFLLGPGYGMLVGFILPLSRSLLFGVPAFFPNALAMGFELLTYGLISGLIFKLFKKKNLLAIYVSLIVSMIIGRGVWGIIMLLFMTINAEAFTFYAFLSGAFITAFPGIILQLILIPSTLLIMKKSKLIIYE